MKAKMLKTVLLVATVSFGFGQAGVSRSAEEVVTSGLKFTQEQNNIMTITGTFENKTKQDFSKFRVPTEFFQFNLEPGETKTWKLAGKLDLVAKDGLKAGEKATFTWRCDSLGTVWQKFDFKLYDDQTPLFHKVLKPKGRSAKNAGQPQQLEGPARPDRCTDTVISIRKVRE